MTRLQSASNWTDECFRNSVCLYKTKICGPKMIQVLSTLAYCYCIKSQSHHLNWWSAAWTFKSPLQPTTLPTELMMWETVPTEYVIDRTLRWTKKEKWSPDHTLSILAIVQHSCANKPATFRMKETSEVPTRTPERRLRNTKRPFTQPTPPLLPLSTPSTY